MTAETTRCPRSVAGVTRHPAVGVRQLVFIAGGCAPGLPVLKNGLGQTRLLVVMRISGRDRIHHLNDFPHFALFDRRALIELTVLFEEPILAEFKAPILV